MKWKTPHLGETNKEVRGGKGFYRETAHQDSSLQHLQQSVPSVRMAVMVLLTIVEIPTKVKTAQPALAGNRRCSIALYAGVVAAILTCSARSIPIRSSSGFNRVRSLRGKTGFNPAHLRFVNLSHGLSSSLLKPQQKNIVISTAVGAKRRRCGEICGLLRPVWSRGLNT